VRIVLQELIELEAAEEIGAGRYQRTDTRVTDRNGSRPLNRPGIRGGSIPWK
jgi:putative transposase